MIDWCFFPFSHITPEQEAIVETFLPECPHLVLDCPESNTDKPSSSFFTPLYAASESSVISSGMMNQIKNQAKDFHNWANMNKLGKWEIKSFFNENPWFSEPDGPLHLASQMRETKKHPENSTEILTKSLLILELMRMMDEANEAIDSRLQTIHQKHQTLFAQLQGELSEKNTAFSPVSSRNRNNGEEDVMAEKRIRAFWQTLLHMGTLSSDRPLILVTTSSQVYDICTCRQQELRNPLDIVRIKVHEETCVHRKQWQTNFVQCFQDFLTGKGMDKSILDISCTNCKHTGYIRFQAITEQQKSWLAPGQNAAQTKSVGLCLLGIHPDS